MGRSNNAVFARRISADEQLYKDSTDKGLQLETVVAAPKMKPDLCSCLLQIVFQCSTLLGDRKHLPQVIETSHSVNVAVQPAKSRSEMQQEDKVCKPPGEAGADLGKGARGSSRHLHMQIARRSCGLQQDPTPD
ncbi:hypothetical protein WISP_16547 [Willisornis vidua]|uniref:Uncharacterized protein n=1 Tax=Willisornis vidua TaxID=1566151 RepID=A0ABQ9DQ39_9PASS|nr:hypothetical protein WISP_16547 [Willisornis vidua]